MDVHSFDLSTSTSLTFVGLIFLPQHGGQAPPESIRSACEQEGQKYTIWLIKSCQMVYTGEG